MGHHDDYNNCTDVTPACPVEATTYGYEPNLAATAFFVAFFFLLAFVQIILGIMWKTRSFMIMMGLACACQAAGQIGRLLMHYNAWSTPGFELQICLLTFAPVFNAAAIYLTIKHITLNLDPSISRIPPARYPWYFLTFDFIVLVLQAAGGGTAATANTDSQRQAGTDIMVAGLVVQVITLVVFGAVVADYFVRLRVQRGNWRIQGHRDVQRFRVFMAAAVVAYVTVLVRCIYRIPELAGGWGNDLMRNEKEYLILDPTMIAIASLVFTIFHPGYFFPQMRSDVKDAMPKQSRHDSEDSVVKTEGYGSA